LRLGASFIIIQVDQSSINACDGNILSFAKLKIAEKTWRVSPREHLLCERNSCKMNKNLITIAAAEKVATLMTLDYIEQRAKRGTREKFERVLAKIAQLDQEPVDGDRLPADIVIAPIV
jgi:hypothetical protein